MPGTHCVLVRSLHQLPGKRDPTAAQLRSQQPQHRRLWPRQRRPGARAAAGKRVTLGPWNSAKTFIRCCCCCCFQVARNANVYFSIPFDVATNDVDNQSFSNTVQACTLAGTALAHSWSCRTANCTDAYKDPTDKKQWVCQSGCNTELYSYNRFYQVRMCPGNGATNVYEL